MQGSSNVPFKKTVLKSLLSSRYLLKFSELKSKVDIISGNFNIFCFEIINLCHFMGEQYFLVSSLKVYIKYKYYL